jgi:hypothetical protein
LQPEEPSVLFAKYCGKFLSDLTDTPQPPVKLLQKSDIYPAVSGNFYELLSSSLVIQDFCAVYPKYSQMAENSSAY